MQTLIRELSEVEYDLGEFSAFLDEDEAFRARNPQVVGGPLRNSLGQMVAVPAFMRLDYRTDPDGPIPAHRPDLGPCWLWTGGLVRGYAYVRVGNKQRQASPGH